MVSPLPFTWPRTACGDATSACSAAAAATADARARRRDASVDDGRQFHDDRIGVSHAAQVGHVVQTGTLVGLIFLRNVLIYFDAPTKREVVDRVLTQLRPGGLFFIGTAEGRVPCDTPLQVLAPGAFRKVAG
jgi:hypothetical protein